MRGIILHGGRCTSYCPHGQRRRGRLAGGLGCGRNFPLTGANTGVPLWGARGIVWRVWYANTANDVSATPTPHQAKGRRPRKTPRRPCKHTLPATNNTQRQLAVVVRVWLFARPILWSRPLVRAYLSPRAPSLNALQHRAQQVGSIAGCIKYDISRNGGVPVPPAVRLASLVCPMPKDGDAKI